MTRTRRMTAALGTLATVLVLTGGAFGCAPPSSATSGPSGAALGVRRAQPAVTPTPSPIQHVIIIDQENRSFDDVFYGYPGANTAVSGRNSKGKVIPLVPISLSAPYDILHASNNFIDAWDNGKMDGFDKEPAGHLQGFPNPQYGYIPDAEKLPYVAMAQQYVLGDNMFTSQIDASFTAHQFIYAATGDDTVNFPGGPWGCYPTPGRIHTLTLQRKVGPVINACFFRPSLPAALDRIGLSWRWYGSYSGGGGYDWIGVQAAQDLRSSPSWSTHVIQPELQFLADVAAGTLANVTWITPNLRYSDHAGARSADGPQYVASLVNAVGQSPFWSSSVIFITWDDWGGWYDHVPPPQLDYAGLGIRVPVLCISPFAQSGVVSHVQYETASIVKFVEKNWGLAPLAVADSRANSAGDGCLSVKTRARAFKAIPTRLRPTDLTDANVGPIETLLGHSERGGD
jgi:phospholipase C